MNVRRAKFARCGAGGMAVAAPWSQIVCTIEREPKKESVPSVTTSEPAIDGDSEMREERCACTRSGAPPGA